MHYYSYGVMYIYTVVLICALAMHIHVNDQIHLIVQLTYDSYVPVSFSNINCVHLFLCTSWLFFTPIHYSLIDKAEFMHDHVYVQNTENVDPICMEVHLV